MEEFQKYFFYTTFQLSTFMPKIVILDTDSILRVNMLVEYQPCCVLTMKIKYFLLTFLKVSCRKILIPWKANWHSCWFFRIFIVQWNWPIKSYQGNIIFYLCWVIIFMFDDFAYFSWYDFSIAISIAAVRIGWYLVFSQHNFTENQV